MFWDCFFDPLKIQYSESNNNLYTINIKSYFVKKVLHTLPIEMFLEHLELPAIIWKSKSILAIDVDTLQHLANIDIAVPQITMSKKKTHQNLTL